MEAIDFPPLNDSMVTITVIFDTLLPQGMLDVEVLKVNAIPIQKLNEKDTPVDTHDFQYWTSLSKASGKCVIAHTCSVQVAAEKALYVTFPHFVGGLLSSC